jgi:hypothetical protein
MSMACGILSRGPCAPGRWTGDEREGHSKDNTRSLTGFWPLGYVRLGDLPLRNLRASEAKEASRWFPSEFAAHGQRFLGVSASVERSLLIPVSTGASWSGRARG